MLHRNVMQYLHLTLLTPELVTWARSRVTFCRQPCMTLMEREHLHDGLLQAVALPRLREHLHVKMPSAFVNSHQQENSN